MNKSTHKIVAAAQSRAFATPLQTASDDRPKFSRAGEVACADLRIPVWRVAPSTGGERLFDGKFVRYADMPAEIERAFREQQVLAGKPFDGAAYVEDFQLFADLRLMRR